MSRDFLFQQSFGGAPKCTYENFVTIFKYVPLSTFSKLSFFDIFFFVIGQTPFEKGDEKSLFVSHYLLNHNYRL
jgi:hypothetical protein